MLSMRMKRFDAGKGRTFAEWIISLDDPDPESRGFQDRRRVTLTEIIKRAEECFSDFPWQATRSDENEALAQLDPEEIRKYAGHWIAVKDGKIICSADSGHAVMAFLVKNELRADSMFAVPATGHFEDSR